MIIIIRYVPMAKPKKDLDIIEFWQTNSKKFPILYDLFLIYHAIPGFSTPSERVFSDSEYQVWDRRNKISTLMVETIMFLFENQDL